MITKTIQNSFLFASLLFSHYALATAYTPKDNDIITASHSLLKVELSIDEIEQLVLNSQNVGQTERLQGALKVRLAKLYQQEPTLKVGYLYARVLQKEHQFDEAIAIAEETLTIKPATKKQQSNTHMLLSNMLMIKGEFSQAKQHCTALIGSVSIMTTSTCVLDIRSQEGQLEQSYNSLLKITRNKEISEYTLQVLSEMAYRLKRYDDALLHLNNIQLNQSPISLIALWADIQLALNNHQKVLSSLGGLLNNIDDLEDSLLIRLAIAEKITQNTTWQTLIKKRIALRELRQDTFHASDLAKYYLEVEPNTSKAIYWATINLKQAKMSSDKQLLVEAQLKGTE
ncbi:tetratricopeptide repeat protein [Pseudocolwellia sp. HL-MZ19]|uniref:tetratricopeptide repeat protein n=1 Tax=unclassified Pseudocolwellia TaxID=2848178 RepID=UPI003CF7F79B